MYDVIVLGAGPAGYKCALSCSAHGMKIAVIDENQLLGGTCLRVGCIPSKAMLHASYKYYEMKSGHLKSAGIELENVRFDLSTCLDSMQKNVKSLSDGISFLFKKNNIDFHYGKATVESAKDENFIISVLNGSNFVELKSKKVVIATGSIASSLPEITIDEEQILSSTGALKLSEIPKSLVVLGGGAIGLEMASVWSRLGTDVTVIELSPQISPSSDLDIAKTLLDILEKQGIKFILSERVSLVTKSNNALDILTSSGKNVKAEKLLIAIGRKPNNSNLPASVELDDRGFVKVNTSYETSVHGIFAIGDVIGGLMLAHKAEFDALCVSEILAGRKHQKIDSFCIPQVIYTHPPVASIGKTEKFLQEHGVPYNVGKSKFSANGRAKVSFCTDGFVKILTHKEFDTILGVHIVGESADVIINEASVALAYGASSEDIYRICHSHPDLSETFRDAAHSAFLAHK